MNTLFRIALTALILAGLSACGAKGPLVLPEKAEPVEIPAEIDADADAGAETTSEATEEEASDATEATPVIPAGK
jgi:predicted small lipoprotein YifL